MPTTGYSFNFTTIPDPVCWNGALSHFELKLLQPLPAYALEQLRVRFLHAVTTTHDPKKSSRVVAQMAFETEVGTVLAKLVNLPPEVALSQVCERRDYIAIDADMAKFDFLIGPALEIVRELGFLPDSYLRFFRTHLARPYAKYRMCAIAAFLCTSSFYLIPDQVAHIELNFNDAATANDVPVETPGYVRSAHDTVTSAETFRLLPTFSFFNAVSAVDTVQTARSGQQAYSDVTSGTSETLRIEKYATAVWTAQDRPFDAPAGVLDFRYPVGVCGVDDYEIYICGGAGGGGTGFMWGWDGTQWNTLTPPSTQPRRLWCNHDASIIYALISGGIKKSTNKGVSWTSLNWPYVFTGDGLWAVESGPQPVLYASFNQGGVAMSDDDGVTWTTIVPQNYCGGGAFCSYIWAYDNDNVFIGGGRTGGAWMVRYKPSLPGDGNPGLTSNHLVNYTNLFTTLDQVMSIWGTSPTNLYLSGYAFAAHNLLLHSTDAFATFQPQVYNTYSGFSQIPAIAGVDEDEIFVCASEQSPDFIRAEHHVGADTWADDGALSTLGGTAMGMWVNPATRRAVLISNHGYLQTNRLPSPGRPATSPKIRKADSLTTIDGKHLG